MTTPALTVISSMATKQVLAELIALRRHTQPQPPIELESVGGVDAARRVAAGEAFDAVVLGADALQRLIDSGHVLAGSRIDVVRSQVAVAVPSGQPHPDLSSADALLQAVLAAPSIGYSTGPSGVQLAQLFKRWGISEHVAGRLVVPPPGVPVGSLVASGQVALGFQQLSELMHLRGIDVVGPLPAPVQIETIFAAGVAAGSRQPEAVRALLAFLASAPTREIKRANGMDAA